MFFKNNQKNNQSSASSNYLPGLKLNMEYVNSSDGQNYQRQIGLSFSSKNSFAFDKAYDSEIYDLGPTDMYFKFPNDTKKYVIAGIQSISDDLEVPLEIVLNYSGTITIQINEISIEREIYLKDNETNKIHRLNNNTVALQLEEGVYTDRFSIVFNENVLSLEDNNFNSLTKDLTVFMNNTSKEIVLKNHKNIEVHKVELYNLVGQKMYEWTNIDNTFENKFNVKNLKKQIYVVNILKEQGNVSKKNIIE